MPLFNHPTSRLFSVALFITALALGAAPAHADERCSTASFKIAPGYDLNVNTVSGFVAADLNGDGRLDVAAAGPETNTVSLLFNDGAGRLEGLTLLQVGGTPNSIASGDFNGDGRPDLAVSNYDADTVSLLFGNGSGGFAAPATFTGIGKPFSLTTADFNGDGKLDVAGISSTAQKIFVLLGDGAGSLAPAPDSPYAVGADPGSLTTADFNADGKLDVVTTNGGLGVYLLNGDGTGRLGTSKHIYDVGTYKAAAADFNSDGKTDLALTSFTGVAALVGDGAGGFGVPIKSDLPYYGGVYGLVASDFDGDGKLDLAGTSSLPSGVIVLKGDGAAGFGSPRYYMARNYPGGLGVADFDADGKPDLGVVSGIGNGVPVVNLSVLRNAGGGAFEAAAFVPTAEKIQNGATPGAFVQADFNADGKMDLAVAPSIYGANPSNSSYISVLLGDGAGGYSFMPDLSYFPGSRITSIVAADFNNDGKLDLAATVPWAGDAHGNYVGVHLGDGTGKFAAAIVNDVYPYGFQVAKLAAYDHNADGKVDVVVTNQSSRDFLIMTGDGTGRVRPFQNAVFLSSYSFEASDIVVRDFNKDGRPDLAFADYKGTGAAVFLNLGPVSGWAVGSAVELNVGSYVKSIVVDDFDADGNLDVAAVAPPFFDNTAWKLPGGRLVFFKGNGSGGFTKGGVFETNMTPGHAVSGDFDGDGKKDVAIVNTYVEEQPNGIRIFSGDGSGGFAPGINFELPSGPQYLLASDFNGDGKTDLTASIPGARAIAVLTNDYAAPLPCLRVEDAAASEGDAAALVTVRLSGASAQPVKVSYQATGYSAARGVDFKPATGTLTFAPGETAKALAVPIVSDAMDEEDESLRVYLSGAVGASVSDAAAAVTLADDDAPPTISVADVSVAEGNSSGSANVNFKVTLSAASAKTVSVAYATSDGTATSSGADQDYFVRTGTLEFAPGVTSLNATVILRGDLFYEPDETFFLNLSQPTNATVADGQAQATILNDDAFPTLTIFDSSAFESASGDTTATFTLRLSNPNTQPVTVNYATADVTATAGADYSAASGTVTFAPGETNKSVAVTVKDDLLDEAVETFNFNLADVSGATLGDAQGVGTIFDNDGPALSVGDVSAKEGQSGLTNFVFTVSLSAASPQPVSVRYTTVPGTAVSNSFPADFQSASTFLNIPAGATSGTFTIRVNGDLFVEPDETFIVNLSSPSDATIADGQAQATILNDDGPGKLQFASAAFSVNESELSALITVVRVDGATGAATVDYTASGGTATDGADYTAVSGTLSFAEGQTSKTFSVPLLNDVPAELEETVNLTLSSPTGAALGDLPAAVLKIGDDPRPVLQFAAAAQTALETDRVVSIKVRRLGDAATPVSVKYATQDGTATERRDYNLTLGVLSFAAGETEKSVEVLLTDDAVPESPETFTLLLSSPAGGRLGDVTTTTVTLGGEDNAGGANPLDASTEFFVRQHYHDFLNREPDAPGLAFWMNEIDQCGSDARCREVKRNNVSAAFFLSIEFQQTGYLVYRTYKAAYGSFPGTPLTVNLRQFMPDTQGLGQNVRVGIGDWEARLEENKRAYLADFVKRPEFVDRYPASLGNEQFVDALNANAGGALSQAERDQLVQQLSAGAKGREEVLRAVTEDADFAAAEFNKAFVLMQYYGYLRRNPNDLPDTNFVGYNFWLGKLNEFNGNYIRAEMVNAFITSTEYRQRFAQ